MQYLLLPHPLFLSNPLRSCGLIMATSVLQTTRSIVQDSFLILDPCWCQWSLSVPWKFAHLFSESFLSWLFPVAQYSVLGFSVGSSPPPKPQHPLELTLQPSPHSSHLRWGDSPTLFFCYHLYAIDFLIYNFNPEFLTAVPGILNSASSKLQPTHSFCILLMKGTHFTKFKIWELL